MARLWGGGGGGRLARDGGQASVYVAMRPVTGVWGHLAWTSRLSDSLQHHSVVVQMPGFGDIAPGPLLQYSLHSVGLSGQDVVGLVGSFCAEVRRQPLCKAPDKAVLVCTVSARGLEDRIDAFNAQCVQNHAYRFGTYDCRHYVDDLAEHLCGKPHVSAAARRIARSAKNNAPAAGLGCGDEPRPLPALGDLHKA